MHPLRLVALTAALFAVTAAPARAAWRAPCQPGTKAPLCTWWNARTTFVADGDTIRVRISGIPGISTIRFIGINAMELHRYSSKASRRRGDCHGVAATNMIDRLIKRSHRRVRVAAQDPRSASGHRLRRSVWVRSGGHWQDLSRLELEAGLVLWLPNPVEWAHNGDFSQLAQEAAAAQRGLYSPASCGLGPDQDLPIKLEVNSDADGGDDQNINDEWVQLTNLGARPLSLNGWWLRDSWLRPSPRPPRRPGYEFPATTVIPPGGSIRLHAGCGSDSATALYWCQRRSVWENVTHDRKHMGDGAYLFDPQGDLRASQIFPCWYACVDPLQGKVKISVRPQTPEEIDLRNVSEEAVDLGDHLLKLHYGNHPDQYIFSYVFAAGSVLQPGETMRVFLQGSGAGDGPLERHLDRRPYVLTDGGNAVSLRTFTDIVVDCYDWGKVHC
jgi:endonuclease YncB( thermonuclease family)